MRDLWITVGNRWGKDIIRFYVETLAYRFMALYRETLLYFDVFW